MRPLTSRRDYDAVPQRGGLGILVVAEVEHNLETMNRPVA